MEYDALFRILVLNCFLFLYKVMLIYSVLCLSNDSKLNVPTSSFNLDLHFLTSPNPPFPKNYPFLKSNSSSNSSFVLK